MEEQQARKAVVDAGRMLLSEGLVARTWGNVSCRTGEHSFVITPSGLGYDNTTADDLAAYNLTDGTWAGARKPSSEKGVHAAAYRRFPDAGFVIHTHQAYASALGLAGFDALALSAQDNAALAGLALAGYGLPGTKRLSSNVSAALATGAQTVLMAHHGALIVGRGLDEAFARAKLLETLCKAACKGQPADAGGGVTADGALAALLDRAGSVFAFRSYSAAPAVCEASKAGRALPAQLDDMAQMVGARLVCAAPDAAAVAAALETHGAVLVRGLGAVCRAETAGDALALKLLTEKACIAYLHARACGVPARLSRVDTALMRLVYQQKYAKKIGD